ncbi:unnamed protein product, partial [Prorocentrum cordatum]
MARRLASAGRVLVLGLGGGVLPAALLDAGARQVVVLERSREVLDFARVHFGAGAYGDRLQLRCADARGLAAAGALGGERGFDGCAIDLWKGHSQRCPTSCSTPASTAPCVLRSRLARAWCRTPWRTAAVWCPRAAAPWLRGLAAPPPPAWRPASPGGETLRHRARYGPRPSRGAARPVGSWRRWPLRSGRRTARPWCTGPALGCRAGSWRRRPDLIPRKGPRTSPSVAELAGTRVGERARLCGSGCSEYSRVRGARSQKSPQLPLPSALALLA